MNIKTMGIQDLESYFNLASKIRDSIIMMARANNNLNTPKVRNITEKYNLLLSEVMSRLNTLENKENSTPTTDEEIFK
jgi:hypothetical protein